MKFRLKISADRATYLVTWSAAAALETDYFPSLSFVHISTNHFCSLNCLFGDSCLASTLRPPFMPYKALKPRRYAQTQRCKAKWRNMGYPLLHDSDHQRFHSLTNANSIALHQTGQAPMALDSRRMCSSVLTWRRSGFELQLVSTIISVSIVRLPLGSQVMRLIPIIPITAKPSNSLKRVKWKLVTQ